MARIPFLRETEPDTSNYTDEEHYATLLLDGTYKDIKLPYELKRQATQKMDRNPELGFAMLNEYVAADQLVTQLRAAIALLNHYGRKVSLDINLAKGNDDD